MGSFETSIRLSSGGLDFLHGLDQRQNRPQALPRDAMADHAGDGEGQSEQQPHAFPIGRQQRQFVVGLGDDVNGIAVGIGRGRPVSSARRSLNDRGFP